MTLDEFLKTSYPVGLAQLNIVDDEDDEEILASSRMMYIDGGDPTPDISLSVLSLEVACVRLELGEEDGVTYPYFDIYLGFINDLDLFKSVAEHKCSTVTLRSVTCTSTYLGAKQM